MAFKLSGNTVVKQHFFVRLVSGENLLYIYDNATIDALCFKASVIRQASEARLYSYAMKKIFDQNGLFGDSYKIIAFLLNNDYDVQVDIVIVPETKCDTYKWIMGA